MTHDQVGLGWRTPLAASTFTHLDVIDLIEVIADDYFEAPPRVLRSMHSLAREVPVVVHGVALGPASVSPIARKRLDRLARVINAIEPAGWSEHLAFVRGGPYEIGHLAAPPRNAATVAGTIDNIESIRRAVGALPALENIATLIDPPDSALSEAEWVEEIAGAAGCPLLLDLHNLCANALNFGHDPCEYLLQFPLSRVRLVHISGGRWIELDLPEQQVHARRLLDDHVHDVPDEVFAMLVELARRCPQPLSIILERDGHYPEFSLLLQQLTRAREAVALGRSRRGTLSENQTVAPPQKCWLAAQEGQPSSAPQFETFLARLYCDRPFLDEFLAAPSSVISRAGLNGREREAALAIDRPGLLMAARSYEIKRRAGGGERSSRWPWRQAPRAWHRVLLFMEKLRAGRPPVDPHL